MRFFILYNLSKFLHKIRPYCVLSIYIATKFVISYFCFQFYDYRLEVRELELCRIMVTVTLLPAIFLPILGPTLNIFYEIPVKEVTYKLKFSYCLFIFNTFCYFGVSFILISGSYKNRKHVFLNRMSVQY